MEIKKTTKITVKSTENCNFCGESIIEITITGGKPFCSMNCAIRHCKKEGLNIEYT